MYDLARLREEFPVLSTCIYLDSASTSQTPHRAVAAMCAYFYEYAANHGRGSHHLARKTTEEYERTREVLGNFLGVDPGHLVFTRNATDAINLVAHGTCWEPGDEVITTALEHHANFLPWMAQKARGVVVKVLPQRRGMLDPADLQEALSPRTRLVAVTHVTNVLGTVQPVREIAGIAHDAGASVLLDAAQSVGHMPLDVRGFDFVALPGHKGLLGPQGTGALYAADYSALSVSCHGGGIVEDVSLDGFSLLPPPARFEPGTPNIPGVIGLGAAIRLVEELGVGEIHRHETRLGVQVHEGLSAIAGVAVYSPRGSPVVSFNLEGMDPHGCATDLDRRQGICVRSGLHCAHPLASSLHPAGTVRASMGCYTTPDEVATFVETVREIAGAR
ncbi:MAG: cysteine desulfurase [Methanolinea sp.]|jgi:cysteine desulfurase/selenocysteine lyase|nr:cysteine desulfurase [Methanolinea sp.]